MSISLNYRGTDGPSNVIFVFVVLYSNLYGYIVLEGSARRKRGRGSVEVIVEAEAEAVVNGVAFLWI